MENGIGPNKSKLVVFFCSGNPLFLEPFWLENEESSAVMVRGLHRMGYTLEAGGSSIITDRLQQLILRLHTVAGNANVTGRFVALGVGSMQLINAAVRALSASNGSQLSTPSKIVATPPFYSVSNCNSRQLVTFQSICLEFYVYVSYTHTYIYYNSS